MSVFALVTGKLVKDPESRVSKYGKPFVTATILSRDGAETIFANVIVFSASAQEAILMLRSGDAVTVQGKASVGVYEKNGEHRASLSVAADNVLALRQPRKPRLGKEREVIC